MSTRIIYEQPLNERIRTFLRLEYLFQHAVRALQGESAWDSRVALATLIDVQNIFGRADLKTEILKELERHTSNLARLEQNPNVDRERLNAILDDLDLLIDRLYALNGQVGQNLRQNEFLNSIRQRSSIPGGTCDFDLPAFHHWLQQPPETRKADLERWLGEFDAIFSAIDLMLRLIRESTPPVEQVAEGGFFQQSLDRNTPYQLIRVLLPREHPCFAEISGGKHRFTVRFMQTTSADQKPVQTEEDITFELSCCAI